MLHSPLRNHMPHSRAQQQLYRLLQRPGCQVQVLVGYQFHLRFDPLPGEIFNVFPVVNKVALFNDPLLGPRV